MALDYGNSSMASVRLAGPFAGGGGGSSARVSAVTLKAEDWKNAESPYFQNVVIDGISASSMVDIQADREHIAQLCVMGTAIHIDNDGGIATAYAIGNKPDVDMTFQVSLTEVTVL